MNKVITTMVIRPLDDRTYMAGFIGFKENRSEIKKSKKKKKQLLSASDK